MGERAVEALEGVLGAPPRGAGNLLRAEGLWTQWPRRETFPLDTERPGMRRGRRDAMSRE
jgi:hypothetical protein